MSAWICWLALGVGQGGGQTVGWAEAHSSAVQWQRWETPLGLSSAEAEATSPLEVDVAFTSVGGDTFQVPAFWDGDRLTVRAAFPSVGTWTWRSQCSDPAQVVFPGKTGVVQVKAYDGPNPLYRHGDLRVSENRRFLVHADGTPFAWLGDTAWNALWKATSEEWREYIDRRAQQRFSVVQVITSSAVPRREVASLPEVGHRPFLPDGRPDPVYWRAVDEKVAYANDRGLVVMLTGLGRSRANFGEQQGTRAFARHVAGRFAGNLVVFSPSMDQRMDPLNERVGQWLRGLSSHLIVQHPGTHLPSSLHYHAAAYTHVAGLQSGHHNGDLVAAYAAAADWTRELWERLPTKPVINLEAMYDARGSDAGPAWRERDVRALGWISWLSGSCGYTYGAGDVPPKVPAASGGMWLFQKDPTHDDFWRKVLEWPSAGQMTHWREFLDSIAWWRLEPAPSLVVEQPESSLRKVAVGRSAAGDLLVAYLPDNAEVLFDLQGLPEIRSGRWFNPMTGESRALSELPAKNARWRLRRPAGWRDAVVVAQAEATAGPDGAAKPRQ